MVQGSPVYITSEGSPVQIVGAGAGSIPASAIANPVGSGNDAPIITGLSGNLIAAAGFNSSVLFQSHIPFIIAPSGTMGNNGAMSAVLTLPFTYAASYVYLPAGAIAAASAAGWYYATWSSTTAGTVFNNPYTTGQPTIPASPTAFVTTGPGAWTGVTATQSGPIYSMPAGVMGIRDTIRVTVRPSVPANTDTKTSDVLFGGSVTMNTTSQASGTMLSTPFQVMISNRDSLSSQVAASGLNTSFAAGGVNYAMLTVNTANAVAIAAQGGHTTATDYCVIESVIIELLQGS